MRLILKFAAMLQAVAAYLSSTLPSLLTLLNRMTAIMRGNEPAGAGKPPATDEEHAAKTDEQQNTGE